MRLSNHYIKTFIAAVNKFLPVSAEAELRLFGSRTNDTLKGGDIDLLLIANNKEYAHQLEKSKPQILANIFMHIEEQKIDLLITDVISINQNPFALQALKQSILLHKFY